MFHLRRLTRQVCLAASVVAVVLLLSGSVLAGPRLVPKIDNFIFFVDYSGSMAMRHLQNDQVKMVMAKETMHRLNQVIPELGYNGGLYTFAPYSQLQPLGPYDKQAMDRAISSIESDYTIFQRLTPMGNGLIDLEPVLSGLSGRTAVIIVSDGLNNLGADPVEQARRIYNTYPNVCFHIISLADHAEGQAILDQIASLKDCSCVLPLYAAMYRAGYAQSQFVNCIFYEEGTAACGNDVISFKTIQFDLDKAVIKDEMKPILDEAARIIMSNECTYELAGHTCSLASESYNQSLSERRAAAVGAYLKSRGVSASTLHEVGYGELQPKFDNNTDEGRSMNRRVEITITGP